MSRLKYINEIDKLRKNFGSCFAFQCAVRRIISFRLYERYIYRYLEKYFNPIIEKYNKYPSDRKYKVTNKVWTLWWQGESEAPEIVKCCIASQRKYFGSVGAEVIVLTKDNWAQYISLPSYILQKVEDGKISLTHLSDIIRARLLETYGGLWIDATVYCIKEDMKEKIFSNMFTIKCHEHSEYLTLKRWTGFLFADQKHSELFGFMSEAFNYYWMREDVLIAYLLIDYIIAIAYNNFSSIREKIDSIPVSNLRLWDMLHNMNQPYDKVVWESIASETVFLKLSYKNKFNGGELRKTDKDGKMTYWGYLYAKWN